MVNKSKLKMALLHEKPVDFKKEHQKKMAKLARKAKAVKNPQESDGEDADEKTIGGGTAEDIEEADSEQEENEDEPQAQVSLYLPGFESLLTLRRSTLPV